MQEDLDLVTADALYQRGRTAIAGHVRLLLLDLSELSFCDARGLSAFVQIANDADATGCRYGLIAPQPQVAKILRIAGLGMRLRAFATIEQACQRLTALAPLAASRAPASMACCGQPPETDHRTRQMARR